MSLDPAVREQIENQIASHNVVLYMKGSPKMPQCGFSARVAGILDQLLEGDYATYNVLEDESIREGIKEFGNWPTIPQLYVNGELVGGCDIITEMTLSGELDQLFEAPAHALQPPEPVPPPTGAARSRPPGRNAPSCYRW